MSSDFPAQIINARIFPVRDGWRWEARSDAFPTVMDLNGWAEDPACAQIHCTQEQVRWLMKQRLPVNIYVIPEIPV